MKKVIFKDKYPVFTTTISKDSIKVSSIDEIIKYFKEKIEAHKIAKFIAVFDHMTHTKSLGGSAFAEGMLDAQNVIFCFGKEILTGRVLAVRPRSIGISEYEDRFEFDFLEAPKEQLQKVMETWVKDLRK